MQDIARIQDVTVAGPSTLAVIWTDGTASAADLGGWIARGGRRFAALGNALVFAGAAVGLYGGNVTWDGDEGDLAIDAENLRMIAYHQALFDTEAAVRWQEDMGVSNVEAADLVGVAPSTWSSYKAGAAIPATVARLCRTMQGDPAALAAHLQPRTAGHPGSGPIYVEAHWSAHLRVGTETTLFGKVAGAVLAFYSLTEEQQAQASIRVRGGREDTYRAPAIRRLHLAQRPDGEAAIRATLEAANRPPSFKLG